jgi:putative tryptophan/tyrosine transport system substrate-binding protein
MQRRQFIAGLGSAAAAWPRAARAQQPVLPVVGYLNSETLETYHEYFTAFHQGLNDTGSVEGHNVLIDYLWAGGQNDRLAELAADLVRRRMSVIATNNTPASLAAKAATQVIVYQFFDFLAELP